MDYEQKYNKLVEYIDLVAHSALTQDQHELMDSIRQKIYESKESEDEKIRKALLTYFSDADESYDGIPYPNIRAWLEKQGEKKPAFGMKTPEESLGIDSDTYNKIVDECVYGEQKPADKVEPKFKVGDWVVDKNGIVEQILSYKDGIYKHTDGYSAEIFEDEWRMWTIQDAKDGDVLYLQKDGKEHIIIYKGVIKERFRTFVSAYCAYNGIVDAFCFADVSRYVDIAYGGIMPATKEQRDLLFQKMKEDGYEWDSVKKELKKIEQKTPWLKELKEKLDSISKEEFQQLWDKYKQPFESTNEALEKPAWSEEDERMFNSALWHVKNSCGNGGKNSGEFEVYNWLKSLKYRYTWKPSDEHYELEEFAKIVRGNLTGISEAVQELFKAKYLQLTGNKMYGGYKD